MKELRCFDLIVEVAEGQDKICTVNLFNLCLDQSAKVEERDALAGTTLEGGGEE